MVDYIKEANDKDYCLWRHFVALYKQAAENRKADFGEPCAECKLREECKSDWIKRIGYSKPDDIELKVGKC